jgi:hypothetical protein
LKTNNRIIFLKISLIFIILQVLYLYSDNYSIPRNGRWKNIPLGSWVVTKNTTINYNQSKKKIIRYQKFILVGENKYGDVYLISGACDGNYQYLSRPGFNHINPKPFTKTKIESFTKPGKLIFQNKSIPS